MVAVLVLALVAVGVWLQQQRAEEQRAQAEALGEQQRAFAQEKRRSEGRGPEVRKEKAPRPAESEGEAPKLPGEARRAAKTQYTADDLQRLKDAFAGYAGQRDEASYRRYEREIAANYVVEQEMAQHPDYFVGYAEELIAQLKTRPELRQRGVGTYYQYLAEDLDELRAPAAAEKAKALRALLGLP